MPSNTVTPYRERNPRGRDKRKSGPTHIDVFHGKVGNALSFRGCSFCYPTLSRRVQIRAEAKKECLMYQKGKDISIQLR